MPLFKLKDNNFKSEYDSVIQIPLNINILILI